MEQPLHELAAVNGQAYSYDPNRKLHRAAKKEKLELFHSQVSK
ncbi:MULTISPECIES: hypothetical protein [Paenibacillus]|nr:hypothetical protein [Paenibacillus lautus]